jgi:predicted HAD superfamily Cof-like phosphohydrolase
MPPIRSFISGMVYEFHDSFELPIGDTTRTLNKLRADLILEEAGEAVRALLEGTLEEQAKEFADLVYVVYGAAVTLGIDLDKALLKVHESNMSKLVDGKPVMRPDGKVLKGPNYRPPDMSRCIVDWSATPRAEGGEPE